MLWFRKIFIYFINKGYLSINNNIRLLILLLYKDIAFNFKKLKLFL